MRDAFCTLFDTSFAPQGIAMLESLNRFLPEARKIVLAMDEGAARLTQQHFGNKVDVVTLSEFETSDLVRIRAERTRKEYCWTLTPFLPSYVLEAFPDVGSATYVDADVYFFHSPQPILGELETAKKTVLITDHGYDPKYDQAHISGRFCVQFVTFKRSESSQKVLNWWKARCLEWCFDRVEDGRFGDQKYLDQWPDLFSDCVHIYSRFWNTLAPWNLEWWLKREGSRLHQGLPIFYHFHGLRIYSKHICLWAGYVITKKGKNLIYRPYLKQLSEIIKRSDGDTVFQFSPWTMNIKTPIKLLIGRMAVVRI